MPDQGNDIRLSLFWYIYFKMADQKGRRLKEILDRLELVSSYDIRVLTETDKSPEIVWKNLHFTVAVSCKDEAKTYYDSERLMLLKRACRIEEVPLPHELDMLGFKTQLDLYPLTSGISNNILEGSRSKGRPIDSVHLYLEGWNDRAGARKAELGCYDMNSRSRRVSFRFWPSRLRLQHN